jgi:Tfp pilus assembly PilM family ATPase
LQFFLASGAAREQPEQILICGGCANIPGVAEVIASRVGIAAERGISPPDLQRALLYQPGFRLCAQGILVLRRP